MFLSSDNKKGLGLDFGKPRIGGSGKVVSMLRQFFKRSIIKEPKGKPSLNPPKQDKYSIGISFGHSPLHFDLPADLKNPVLTSEDVLDAEAAYVADPFMLRAGHLWYMFMEVLNRRKGKGEIGLAVSSDGLDWRYQRVVLTEPFHLSYPYVFEWMGEYFMIPESHQAGAVRLYKALRFPTKWQFVKSLIIGHRFSDSSIFRYDNKWWLLTETNPEFKFDTLRLYYSDDLAGSWIEHPRSPVVRENAHIARPGGRVLTIDGRIIRYAQDCYPVYGTQVWAVELSKLTTEEYEEHLACESQILTPSGTGWNGAGMHHIDPHRMDDGSWIACVDGWCWTGAGN